MVDVHEFAYCDPAATSVIISADVVATSAKPTLDRLLELEHISIHGALILSDLEQKITMLATDILSTGAGHLSDE